jgi:hypothetical protein
MIGSCRLCGAVATLKGSHILSAWVFRRILKRGSDPQSVLIEKGTRRFTNAQDTEYLLCERCEQRIGRWENHVSKLAVQPDGSLPALRAVTLQAHRRSGEETPADGAALGIETAHFAASVVWRESVRSQPSVRLGPYAGEFHAYVSGQKVTLEHARLLVHLIDPEAGPFAAESGSYPVTLSGVGCREHQFMVPGMHFTFRVGGAIPTTNDGFCFIRTKKVWVVDGKQVANWVRRKYQSAKALGKLRLQGR